MAPAQPEEENGWCLEENDMLGEDLQEDLRQQASSLILTSPLQGAKGGNLSIMKRPLTSQTASPLPPKQGEFFDTTLDQSEAGGSSRSKKKEPKKKEAQKREGRGRRGQQSPSLLINAASKKIQNAKGRSPIKRLAKSGPSKQRGPRSTRKPTAFPFAEVFPSSRSKPSTPIARSAENPSPPATIS